MNLFEEFHNVIRALDDNGVPYAVVGGLALAIHGVARATEDIDLLLREADLERALTAVAEIGFDLPAGLMTFDSSDITVKRVSKAEHGELLTLDLLLVSPPLEPIWQSRVSLESSEGAVWVVARESLVRMKAMSGRLKDLADIQALQMQGGDHE